VGQVRVLDEPRLERFDAGRGVEVNRVLGHREYVSKA